MTNNLIHQLVCKINQVVLGLENIEPQVIYLKNIAWFAYVLYVYLLSMQIKYDHGAYQLNSW